MSHGLAVTQFHVSAEEARHTWESEHSYQFTKTEVIETTYQQQCSKGSKTPLENLKD